MIYSRWWYYREPCTAIGFVFVALAFIALAFIVLAFIAFASPSFWFSWLCGAARSRPRLLLLSM